MTLAIAFVAAGFAGIVTDRKISGSPSLSSDEYTKSGIVDWKNGRYAYSFSGLAALGDFDASAWLAEAICDSGAPDGDAAASMDRLTGLATRKFRTLRATGKQKRFTVVFVGYATNALGITARQVLVLSNYESLHEEEWGTEAGDFRLSGVDLPVGTGLVVSIGSGRNAGSTLGDGLARMVRLLEKPEVPPSEVVRAAVGAIRSAADDLRTAGTVGRHCSSLVMAEVPDGRVSCGYHIEGVADVYHLPAYVCAAYDRRGAWLSWKAQYAGQDDAGRPIVLVTERVHKRAICPCGSGLKYVRCHGARVAPGISNRLIGGQYFMLKQSPTENVEIMAIKEVPGAGRIDALAIGPIEGWR